MDKRCETCRFWYQSIHDHDYGSCDYPDTAETYSIPDGRPPMFIMMEVDAYSVDFYTRNTFVCSEWQPKETA